MSDSMNPRLRSNLVALARIVGLLSALALAPAVLGAQASPEPAAGPPAVVTDALHTSARAFRDSLGAELAARATFTMDDPERRAWSNLPTTMFKRLGVSFGELTDDQRIVAHSLLQTPLSSQGYLKVAGIMRADEILKGMSPQRGGQSMFGQDLYFLGLFGDLDAGVWGLQLDGHHLALNLTVVGDQVWATPMFKGSDPAQVRSGLDAGWYPLFAEDQRGRALWASLEPAQRALALLEGATPTDVIAGPTRTDPIAALEIQGLSYASMSPMQQLLLLRLLAEWTQDLEPALASAHLERVREGGLENLRFAWSGTEEGKPYYFRIHGPTVLIEFDNNYPPGRSGGAVNHIHSVWRDPTRDYGEDLLARHYRESPHHRD